MKQLWAPWRAEYIQGNNEHNKEEQGHCIFCKEYITNNKNTLCLYKGTFAAVMMNKFPYNNGHLLVYPFKHTASLEDIGSEETLEIFGLIRESTTILRTEMKPDGFNIGINLGKAAGAGIDKHMHFHIVPRWNGDTNFMPVMSEVKILPEHLLSTYNKLYPHFQKLNIS